MTYLYHHAPKNLQGCVLYPLNVLKDTYPDVYECEVLKYKGREEVLRQWIPTLSCFWNDVLHLAAVHPKDIQEAIIQSGGTPSHEEYYEIDPFLLPVEDTTVYLYDSKYENKRIKDDCRSYDPSNIKEYADLPHETKAYYAQMLQKGEKPLLHHLVPHILYKGSLETRHLTKILV